MSTAHLLVNVDSDPDPVDTWQDDPSILTKYARMRDILAERTGGLAAWSILTGPKYRSRFFEPPYVEFWKERQAAGADLVLHPEEDLYGPGPGTGPESCSYTHTDHMREVIVSTVARARAAGLHLAAYRGGYHGFTAEIGAILREVGIGIDLSCAPGVEWPNKAALWKDAPLSAYYMSATDPAARADGTDEAPLFEIPWAWDAVEAGRSSRFRFVVGENYMINEFSTEDAMKRVWDTVMARADQAGTSQIVSMVCHTFTMGQPEYEDRLNAVLQHVAASGGRFTTPSQARQLFDRHNATG